MLWEKVENVIFNFYFHSLLTLISKTKTCEPKTDVHMFANKKKFHTKNANKIPKKTGVNW